MSSTRRTCVFPGCHSLNGDNSRSFTLFTFPKDDGLRKRWVDFVEDSICGKLKITTQTRLCSLHFTPDSFINYNEVTSGIFKSPLALVSGAEPTIKVPGMYPANTLPTAGPIIAATAIKCEPESLHPIAIKTEPHATAIKTEPHPTAIKTELHPTPIKTESHPIAIKTEPQYDIPFRREVGSQTDIRVFKRTVATQLSMARFSSRRNMRLQCSVATKSVCVGTDSQPLPPYSSTLAKRKAVPAADAPPAKHPLLEQSSLKPSDPSYLPSVSELTDTTADTPQYLVFEDCLLELFKTCPTCSRVCTVETFAEGTFLSVIQKCLHQSCLYTREWKTL